MTQDWRNQEFEDLPRIYRVVFGMILVSIGVGIGYVLFVDKDGYLTNLFTEAISIGTTVFILNTLAEMRANRELKAQLIREMGASDNGIARRAANELKVRGWLFDGSLKSAHLWGANLQESLLMKINLDEASLWGANFQEACLIDASLEKAELFGANLRGSDLEGVNLRDANLWDANLQEANLWDANLQGVFLMGASLKGASLMGANLQDAVTGISRWEDILDENTSLPDGTRLTSGTDMKRFTDPDHPEFWRPPPGSVWWYPEDSE